MSALALILIVIIGAAIAWYIAIPLAVVGIILYLLSNISAGTFLIILAVIAVIAIIKRLC